MIQVDKIWLFETEVLEPFFFGKKDGVSAIMKDERTIELLNIDLWEYMLTDVVKGGLEWKVFFGGEDNGVLRTLGKQEYEYSLSFDVPLYSGKIIDEMVGRQFSVLCETRNGQRLVVFGQFEADTFGIDNDQVSRIDLSTGRTSAKRFNVNSFNIGNIVDVIDISSVCANLDKFNRMNFDFFPTTNIPINYSIDSVSFTTAVVSWGKSLGANGYQLEWSEDGIFFPNIINIEGGGIENYEITGLPSGDIFHTRIKAIGDDVNSLYSPVISDSTIMGDAPNAPSGLILAVIGTEDIDSTWNDQLDADSYTIEWDTDPLFSAPDSANVLVSNYSITGLDSGTTYYVRVLATNVYGDSPYSSVESATTNSIPFIFTVDTGVSNTFSYTQNAMETFTGDVKWEDGVVESFVNKTGVISHDYGAPYAGNIEVSGVNVYPVFTGLGDELKILDVVKIGGARYGSASFLNCSNLTHFTATDAPRLSGSLLQTFRGCSSLVGNDSWNDWDVSAVTNLEQFARDCQLFNANVEGWDTSLVSNMERVFINATSFSRNLGGWNISSVVKMPNMLSNCGMSTADYNLTLHGWVNGVSTIPLFMLFGAAGLVADNTSGGVDGLAARTTLINTYFWTIIDATP